MPNNIKINLPTEAKQEFERIEGKLLEVENKYAGIIGKSVKKSLRKLVSHGKKKNLKKELDTLKIHATNLYSIYYEDEDFRKKLETLLDRIDANYCEAGIKPLKVKIKLKKYKTKMIKTLKIIEKAITDLDKNEEELSKNWEKFNSKKSEIEILESNLKNFSSEAKQIGIEVDYKSKSLDFKNFINRYIQSYTDARCNFNQKYKHVLQICNKSESNWETLYNEASSLLKEAQDSARRTINGLERFKSVKPLEKFDEKIEELKTVNKELEKKIKFAKELEKYVVFDNNMGVEIKNSNDTLNKMKETYYGEYINCASQPCLEIAKEERKMVPQYDHDRGRGKVYVGPYYIIVDENGKKIGEAFTTRLSATINKSSAQPAAEREVENYLKHALQAGEFKNDQTWLK